MANKMENTCRCCLGTGASQSIFKSVFMGQQAIMYSEMIAYCSSFPVSHTDNLPGHICFGCLSELDLAYKFRLKCDQTYKTMKNMKEYPIKFRDTKDILNYVDDNTFMNDDDKLLLKDDLLPVTAELEDKPIKQEYEENADVLNEDSCGERDDLDMGYMFQAKNEVATQDSIDNLDENKSELLSTLKMKIKISKVCHECGLDFKKKSELKKHMKLHHNIELGRYFCEICQKFYKSERRHRSFHTPKEEVLECKMCDKKFYKNHVYETHMQIHSDTRGFVCGECGASFKQYAGLYKHSLTHQDKNYHCEYCAKNFRTKYNLRVHLRIHTKERPYTCPVCPKSFITGNARNAHLFNHTEKEVSINEDMDKDLLQTFLGMKMETKMRSRDGSKDFPCTYCDKTFKRMSYLEEHINTHLGIKSYFCEICQKFCISKRRHSYVHAKKTVVTCEICKKSFKCKQTLREHQRTHSDIREFICHCGASFRQKAALHKHKVLHEEKAFVCHYCSKTFSTKYKLSIHIRIHTKERPFSCDQCPRKFVTGNLLNIHKLRHGADKNIACHLCEKTFKTKTDLRQHIKVHEKDRRYPCKVCKRAFYRSDHRTRHEAMVHSLDDKTVECDESK